MSFLSLKTDQNSLRLSKIMLSNGPTILQYDQYSLQTLRMFLYTLRTLSELMVYW